MKLREKSAFKYFFRETDWILYLMCVAASVFGAFMVYSATYHSLDDGEFMVRDCMSTVLGSAMGIIICLVVSYIDYEFMMRLSVAIGAVCLLLMFSLFIWGEAPSNRSDAICWLRFGSLSFQPSELVKIGFIITFSTHLDAVKQDINSLKNILLVCLHGAVPTGLVVITGDVGSALVFAVIFVGLMFLSGVNLRYFAVAIVAGIIALPVLWVTFFSEYQKQRFLAIYYPEALSEAVYDKIIYQQERGVNAIGSGMFLGDGYLNGTYTQSGGVPVSESDMIFSVIGEELGFIGCMAALAVIAIIIFRMISNGKKSRNFSGYLLCSGIALMLGSQAVINIGMCLKLLPCIGITLPFLSSGGSSILCIYIGIGVALSVYRYNANRDPVSFRVRSISTPFKET